MIGCTIKYPHQGLKWMGFLKNFLHSKLSARCVNLRNLTDTKVKPSYLIALKGHTNNCVSDFFGQSEDTSKIDGW